jgi:hypothetical protein
MIDELTLPPDSVFRRLPVDWPRRQVLFTDAVRLSAQMAAFSLQNLERILKSLVNAAPDEALGERAVEAMAYAYGVIDAANRFREVLRSFPGLKQNEVFKLFIRATAGVERLRDITQHLNRELKAIDAIQSAALGTITWLGPSPTEDSPPTAWVLQPGSFYNGQRTFGPLIDREARLAPGEIGQVSLVTSGVRVDLTDVVRRIHRMLAALEPSVREHSKGKELLGSDVLLHFTLRPVGDHGGDPSVDTTDLENAT